MKGDYQNELNDLRNLKDKFIHKFSEIESQQIEVEKKFKELAEINEKQDQRLSLLEIQEEISTLLRNEKFSTASTKILQGLTQYPDDEFLHTQHVYCLRRLQRYDDAMSISKNYFDQYRNINTLADYIELSILLEKTIDYEQLIINSRSELVEYFSEDLIWFFDTLRLYFKNDPVTLINHIKSNIDSESKLKNIKIIDGWMYDEARDILSYKEDNELKSIIYKLMEYLDGKISGQEFAIFMNDLE